MFRPEATDPRLPLAVRQRLEGSLARAQSNLVRLHEGTAALFQRLQVQFRALQRPQKRLVALRKLRTLAAEFSHHALPYTACRQQCTHCCHIPVALFRSEALLIGKAIGRTPRDVYESSALAQRHYGADHACPFLVEGRCSIYAHRPLACRVHLNLDDDETLCRLIPGVSVPVPLANAQSFHALYVRFCAGEPLADIREFFPRQ